LLVLCANLAAQAPARPDFSYDIIPQGVTLERSPGATFLADFDLTLTTANNPSETLGAQGWSLSIVSQGVEIAAITTRGTVAAAITDTPPGLRDNGFEKSEVTRRSGGACEPGRGAVSAVVLSLPRIVTLPPDGTVTVARLTVEGQAPSILGEDLLASLLYLDGCTGSGMGISNVVTWDGSSHPPATGSLDFRVRATAEVFRRGDPNADGKVDLSDAVMVLGCKFLGERCPGCRDAGDANDDGLMDVSDPFYILGFLFLGGPPPRPPAGLNVCGTDPTPDSLPFCDHRGC
jgi:hypothetical protein